MGLENSVKYFYTVSIRVSRLGVWLEFLGHGRGQVEIHSFKAKDYNTWMLRSVYFTVILWNRWGGREFKGNTVLNYNSLFMEMLLFLVTNFCNF